jgi:CubicO group peptidase (beta-lactamase class C family)
MAIDWPRLLATVEEHVAAGAVPGAILAVDEGAGTRVAAVGATSTDGRTPLTGDAVVRISSMTKPLVAALAMMLVEDGVLAVGDPVQRWLPELADRRVLRRLAGPPTDTVPADRPITVDDVLTMRMGFGFVLDSPCPTVDLAAAAGLGIGPPDPGVPLTPDEWLARFAELPLLHQPGTDWRYDLSYGVLGVLLARAADRPLDDLLHERLLAPLGMADTGFVVPAADRLVPCYTDDGTGLTLFDPAVGSRWADRPAFPDPRGGLVSTAADYLRFARLLLTGGGTEDGTRLLGAGSVAAMTTDRLGPERAGSTSAAVFLSGGGWGYGVEVVTPEHGTGARIPRYGWGGGLGTTWYSFPEPGVAAVLLTQCLPPPEPLVDAFWTTLHAMIGA